MARGLTSLTDCAMWCSACQQDVPAITQSEGTGATVCLGCGRSSRPRTRKAARSLASATIGGHSDTLPEWESEAGNGPAGLDSVGDPMANAGFADHRLAVDRRQRRDGGEFGPDQLDDWEELPDFIELDDWELQQDLRTVERVLRQLRQQGDLPDRAVASGWPGSEHLRLDPPTEPSLPPRHLPAAARSPDRWLLGGIAWTLLALGTTGFVCGVALLIWTYLSSRSELWTLGMPITLIGQAVLMLGILLQLEGRWKP